jgi:hypothetical protein
MQRVPGNLIMEHQVPLPDAEHHLYGVKAENPERHEPE